MVENHVNFHHQEDSLIIEIMLSASRAIGYMGDDYRMFCVGNFLLTFETFQYTDSTISTIKNNIA